jgi:hypothetical protein
VGLPCWITTEQAEDIEASEQMHCLRMLY